MDDGVVCQDNGMKVTPLRSGTIPDQMWQYHQLPSGHMPNPSGHMPNVYAEIYDENGQHTP